MILYQCQLFFLVTFADFPGLISDVTLNQITVDGLKMGTPLLYFIAYTLFQTWLLREVFVCEVPKARDIRKLGAMRCTPRLLLL